MPTRQRTLSELATQSKNGGTNPTVRSDLQVYSTTQVDSLIAGINLTPYALNSTVVSVSGNLHNEITAVNTSVINVSGALATDIDNLDLSLTQKISHDCVQSNGTSGAATTIAGYINVTINGVTFKMAIVA